MKAKRLAPSQDVMALLALLAMVIWFSWEIIWDGQVPFYRDLGPYFYPIRFSLSESFLRRELPLWDRHMGMGFPLMADFQSGVFYPPHIFYLFFPFFFAVRLSFVFHYLVAAAGSYLLGRSWRYPPYLALIGAILFTFGGVIVSLTNLLNHFQTAVWLPWLVLSWERVLLKRSGKPFLFFLLISLLQFLAGSPEIYVMSVGMICLDGLRVRSAESGVSYRRICLILLGANALVAGLAMVQVLPTAELLLESRWAKSLPFVESSLWPLHPFNLINLFLLDKEVNTGVHNGFHLFFLREIPFLISCYLGAITPLGVCFWFCYGSRKENGLLLGFIGVSLILALGDLTPVYPLVFRYVPIINLFRFPEKFFFFTYGLLLFMAFRGLSAFLHSDPSVSRGPMLILLSFFLLLLLPYLYVRFDTLPLSRLIAWATASPLPSTATLHITSAAIVSLERQIVLVFGLLVLFFLGKRGSLRKPLFEILLVLLVFVDLNSAHRPYQFVLDPGRVTNSPRILEGKDIQLKRLFYYPGETNLHPNYYVVFSRPSFAEFNSLIWSNLLPNTGVFTGIDYLQEIDALRRWPYLIFLGIGNKLPSDARYRLFGALNVEYIVAFRPLAGEGVALLRHFPEYPSWLYRVQNSVPRTYVVPDVMVEKDPVQTVGRLAGKKFNPLREVILAQPLFQDRPPGALAQEPFQGRAEIVRYENRKVVIHASVNEPGVLVLTDSFYPGWRVTVDGVEGEILRANLLFRAVPLPAGDHVVEFRYQPRSFAVGLYISLVSLAAISIWAVYLFVGPRQDMSPPKSRGQNSSTGIES